MITPCATSLTPARKRFSPFLTRPGTSGARGTSVVLVSGRARDNPCPWRKVRTMQVPHLLEDPRGLSNVREEGGQGERLHRYDRQVRSLRRGLQRIHAGFTTGGKEGVCGPPPLSCATAGASLNMVNSILSPDCHPLVRGEYVGFDAPIRHRRPSRTLRPGGLRTPSPGGKWGRGGTGLSLPSGRPPHDPRRTGRPSDPGR